MRLTLSISMLLLWLVGTSETAAPAILLGSIHDRIDFADHYSGGAPITEQHFALAFQTLALPLPTPDPSAWPYTSCIGCDRPIPLGWTGTVDFNSGTGYTDFITRLTNGVNDGSLWQLQVLTRSGRLAGAFGTVADEYDWFAPRSRIDQWIVEAVRLRVIKNHLLLNNDIAIWSRRLV
jgi:hypothetical protein